MLRSYIARVHPLGPILSSPSYPDAAPVLLVGLLLDLRQVQATKVVATGRGKAAVKSVPSKHHAARGEWCHSSMHIHTLGSGPVGIGNVKPPGDVCMGKITAGSRQDVLLYLLCMCVCLCAYAQVATCTSLQKSGMAPAFKSSSFNFFHHQPVTQVIALEHRPVPFAQL